jgi:molybdopterin synthase catalytic subunit
MVEILDRPLDIQAILGSVMDPSAGGVDLFIGTTRDNSRGKKVLYLEYETYRPMALRLMNRIVQEAREKWDVRSISVEHRIGKVGIGEASVVVAVSAAHRKEAFEACRFVIDALKKDVPIWKKEHFVDGEVWVGM